MRDRIWTISAAVIAAGLVGGAGYSVYRHLVSSDQSEVHYPYWCSDCRAVFDVEELRRDYPRNWRTAPGGPNESVVICVRCDKGTAYPVARCGRCGKHYVMYIVGDGRCPYCYPESLAKVPPERRGDLTPPEVKRLDGR
jgi:hypothetical protein